MPNTAAPSGEDLDFGQRKVLDMMKVWGSEFLTLLIIT